MEYSDLTISHLPRAGDIILTRRKKSLLGRLIRRFQTKPNDTTKTIFEHVGIMVNGIQLVEALHRVEVSALHDAYPLKKYDYLIARINKIDKVTGKLLAAEGMKFVGKSYGYGKIITHYLDYLVSRAKGKDVFFFRKLARSKRYPICSWLVAFVYDEILDIKFNKVPKTFCQPDDIADDILITNHDKYELVFVTKGICNIVIEQLGNKMDDSVEDALQYGAI